jgi:hypothetical protein
MSTQHDRNDLRTGDADAMPTTRAAAIVTDNFILTLFQFCTQKRPEEERKEACTKWQRPVEANKKRANDN